MTPPRKPGSTWARRFRGTARGLGCGAALVLLLGLVVAPEWHRACAACRIPPIAHTNGWDDPGTRSAWDKEVGGAFRYAESGPDADIVGICTCGSTRHPDVAEWPQMLLDAVVPAPAPTVTPVGGARVVTR